MLMGRYQRKIRVAAILLLVCAAAIGVTPAAFAQLSRATLLSAEEAAAWTAVGRVNVAGERRRSMCTGTLIAPDVVLTAAHCLTAPGTNAPFPAGQVHFVAGWHQGKSVAHSRAAHLAFHQDWFQSTADGLTRLESDLALIRLIEPMTPPKVLAFGTDRPPLPGDPLTLISYRRDRPHALTHQPDCPYRAIIGQVLELECPVTYGASGAPVFAAGPDGQRVVAVLAAMGNGRDPQAFAVRIDTVLQQLLDQLPAADD